MKSKSPLITSPELQITSNILLMSCSQAWLREPTLLFRELKRDIRKRQIHVGTSEEVLLDWFKTQCAAVLRSLPNEKA